MMDAHHYIEEMRQLVEEHLAAIISPKHLPQDNLYLAAKYSLMAGGKRLRPLLAIAAAASYGCSWQKVMLSACALELVHTYSLIHDDLPCMDDDDLRRGKPTLHKVFPEAHAILAGDYLLTYAFELIATDDGLSDAEKIKLIVTLAESAGGEGMIGGQVMDIEAEDRQISLESLEGIHKHKTGALLAASVVFGGIIGGAPPSQLEILKSYGQTIGLAFQIIDDVLDVTQPEEILGKTAKSDIANHKSTYVTLMGLDQARQAAQALFRSAQEILRQLPIESSLLENLSTQIINRKF